MTEVLQNSEIEQTKKTVKKDPEVLRAEILQYHKDYYKNKKEYFENKFKERVFCEHCNREYKKWNFHQHLKSAKHLKNADPKTKILDGLSSDDILELLLKKVHHK